MTVSVAHAAQAHIAGQITWLEYRHRADLAAFTWGTRNPSGLCQCGCGQHTPISKLNLRARGLVKGEPIRFIKGHYFGSLDCRARASDANAGRSLTAEHRMALSRAKKGRRSTMTDEQRATVGARWRGRKGPEHSRWKGDAVGYSGLHKWVSEQKERTGICSECSTPAKTHWANISGEYKRDPNDYRELCPRCHLVEHGNIPA